MVLGEQHISKLEIDLVVAMDSWETYASVTASMLLTLMNC